MPKMQVTEAEAALVVQNRKRLKFDNTDWSKEQYLNDRDIIEMSFYVVERLLTSSVWIRSDCMSCYVNIAHPDNKDWYLEYLQGLVSTGVIKVEEVPGALRKLPVYSRKE